MSKKPVVRTPLEFNVLAELGTRLGMDKVVLASFPTLEQAREAYAITAHQLDNSGVDYLQQRGSDLRTVAAQLFDGNTAGSIAYRDLCSALTQYRLNLTARDHLERPSPRPLLSKSHGDWSWTENYGVIDPRCLPLDDAESALGNAQPNSWRDNHIITNLVEALPKRCRKALTVGTAPA